tara:strand:+ start:1088 stop:1969 length:882 start_codon:yes stop_codon:yes gene_type:complete
MMLMDFDKSNAEWVVVAYLSQDQNMLNVIEQGKSAHTITGALISGCTEEQVEQESKVVGLHTDPDTVRTLREQLPDVIYGEYFLPRTMSIRQAGKKSNHGLNYGLGYRSFALHNEMDETDAKKIVKIYRTIAYPGIEMWWDATRRQLQDNRTLTNCFGRQRKFLDGWGTELFEAAYAFIPQSTVVDLVNRGMVSIFNDERPEFEAAQLLAQVHDSLLLQYPTEDWTNAGLVANRIALEYMNPTIVYKTKEFQIATTLKIGQSWGNMHEVEISEDPDRTGKNLEKAWQDVQEAR